MDNKDELYHYGVMGMKWGRHKYANSPGTYTQKGLSVFDDKMSDYNSANKKVQKLKKSGDKQAYKEAKSERKVAKKLLNRSYSQLKLDAKADKGKKLYQQGKSIVGIEAKFGINQAVIGFGMAAGQKMLYKYTNDSVKSAKIVSAAAVGLSAVNAISYLKSASDARYLRAYYGHSRDVKSDSTTKKAKK